MKIAVVGAGSAGLVTAACLAELGNEVLCVDSDPARVTLLQSGGLPSVEPGLDEWVLRNRRAGRLRFSTVLPLAVRHGEVIFMAMEPSIHEDGSADLRAATAVARQIGQHLDGFKVVVNQSGGPVGTVARIERAIRDALPSQTCATWDFVVVAHPTFLSAGTAIPDFMAPDRIVVGLPEGPAGERARQLLTWLFAPLNRGQDRSLWMDVASAELCKCVANTMLATRIACMNEMAALADALGADIDAVRRAIGADRRIGSGFLHAGAGFGGSGLPRDIRALLHTAAERNLQMPLVAAVQTANTAQKHVLVQQVCARFGQDLRGLRFGLWGLAYKPGTHDMREAPSRTVIAELLARGAELLAHDPQAACEAQRVLAADLGRPIADLPRLHFVDTPLDALHDVDALLVLTEWPCFQQPDFAAMASRMRAPVIFDGRNLYDPAHMQALGFVYQGIGRRSRSARPVRVPRSSHGALLTITTGPRPASRQHP